MNRILEALPPPVTLCAIIAITIVFVLDYLVLVPKGWKRWSFSYLVMGKHNDHFEVSKEHTPFNEALCMNASAVRRGQVWRLFSSMLLHGGLIHILGNAATFWIAGSLLERQIGPLRYGLVLLCGALAANLCNWRVLQSEFSFGASGATFGAIGVLTAMLLREPQLLAAFSWPQRIWLLVYILFTFWDKWNTVEHGGAFISGILMAFLVT